jgi:hypothetical protein
MVKWVIEASLQRPPGGDDPPLVSEPFLTEEGARAFAILLNEKGYAITAKIVADADEPARTIAGAELLKWLNPPRSN